MVFVSTADAYRVRLAWQPVASVAGYKLYAHQNGYPGYTAIDLGLPAADASGVLHYEHGGLLVESTHSFALASYDAARTESPRSNELSIAYAQAATVVDSDGDGLTDAQEDTNLNLVRDAGETDRLRADTDGDGVSDGAEVAAGSDPTNATSRPNPTSTPTPVRTATPPPTPTRTATRTVTPTRTATRTPTPTRTTTPVPTTTPTRTATAVPTTTVTRTTTAVATVTGTPTPAASATPTRVATFTPTRVATATAARTATPAATTTNVAAATSTRTPFVGTPVPTVTPATTERLEAPTILDVERID